jgi:hypothetical protein
MKNELNYNIQAFIQTLMKEKRQTAAETEQANYRIFFQRAVMTIGNFIIANYSLKIDSEN